jgi:hypothetical protein
MSLLVIRQGPCLARVVGGPQNEVGDGKDVTAEVVGARRREKSQTKLGKDQS